MSSFLLPLLCFWLYLYPYPLTPTQGRLRVGVRVKVRPRVKVRVSLRVKSKLPPVYTFPWPLSSNPPAFPLSTLTYTGTDLLNCLLPSRPPRSTENLGFWLRVRVTAKRSMSIPDPTLSNTRQALTFPDQSKILGFALGLGLRVKHQSVTTPNVPLPFKPEPLPISLLVQTTQRSLITRLAPCSSHDSDSLGFPIRTPNPGCKYLPLAQ